MIGDYLTMTATRLRITAGKNADGTPSETIDQTVTIAGRLRTLSKNVQYTNEKRTVYATHRFYCLPSDLTEADRLSIGGVVYKIAAVNNVMNFNIIMQVDLYRAG